MYDQIIVLLTILITFLSVLTAVFIVLLIIVLIALKKTLIKLQVAIDNVEDTAIRSLAPLLSLRAIFSDFNGFLKAISSVTQAITKRKTK